MTKDTKDKLETLKKDELMQLANDEGIETHASDTKATLIGKLTTKYFEESESADDEVIEVEADMTEGVFEPISVEGDEVTDSEFDEVTVSGMDDEEEEMDIEDTDDIEVLTGDVEVLDDLEDGDTKMEEAEKVFDKEARRKARNARIRREQKLDKKIRNERSGVKETREAIPDDLPGMKLDIIPPRGSNEIRRGFGTSQFKKRNNMFSGTGNKITLNPEDRFKKEETPEEIVREKFKAALDPNMRTIFTGRVIAYKPLLNKETGETAYFLMVAYEKRIVLIRLNEFTAPQGGSFKIEVDEKNSTDNEIKKYMNGRRDSLVDFTITYMDPENLDSGWVMGSRAEAMKFYRNKYWFGKTKEVDAEGNHPYFIREGKDLDARVVTILRSGILVEVFGLEVFIPNKDLFHSHVEDTTKEFKNGQKILVRVMSVKRDKKQISCKLSHKATKNDPTALYLNQFGVGDRIFGTVSHVEVKIDPEDPTNAKSVVYVNIDGMFDIYCRMRAGVRTLPVKGQKVSVLIMGKNPEGTRVWGEITHLYELDI